MKIKKIEKGSSEKFNSIKEQFSSLKDNFYIIAGPCSVESQEIMDKVAKELYLSGVKFLRGGAFKPRTSPYDFQGLGKQGIKILSETAKKYGMLTVSEIVDPRYLEYMIEFIDILQVGSRNMQNFELLKEIGKSGHPVILKRGMCATTEEFKFAAEYIACEGNRNITMCERGIRTFETATRNTLDISCMAILKKETQLPVIADLSHSLGRKDILPDIARAVMALGVDGIMVEVHSDPKNALSDNFQQLTIDEFKNFKQSLENPIKWSHL